PEQPRHPAVDAPTQRALGHRRAQVVAADAALLALHAPVDALDDHRRAVFTGAGELVSHHATAAMGDVGEVGDADAGGADPEQLARPRRIVDLDDRDARVGATYGLHLRSPRVQPDLIIRCSHRGILTARREGMKRTWPERRSAPARRWLDAVPRSARAGGSRPPSRRVAWSPPTSCSISRSPRSRSSPRSFSGAAARRSA